MLSWGNAVDGQLGLGGIEATHVAFPRYNKNVGDANVVEVGCGLKHTLLLLKAGKVSSCGSNEKGQLGQDKMATRPGPLSSLDGIRIRHVACGNCHSLALTSKGQVYAWGDGQYGQLGLGMAVTEPKITPRLVKVFKESVVVQICCGANHSLALTQKGEVFSWGLNNHCQLGMQKSRLSSPTPQIVPPLSGVPVVQLSAGRGHSVALTMGGAALTWGRNNFGQLGIGSIKDEDTPTQVSVLEREVVRHVACGEEHTAFLTESGKVFTCGSSSHGQLGHGSERSCDVPTLVQALQEREVWQLACGRMHTVMVVGGEGSVYACGISSSGQLGLGKSAKLLVPTLVSLGTLSSATATSSAGQGTSVDPEGEQKPYKLKRIFAGGDQTFATFVVEEKEATDSSAPNATSSPTSSSASNPQPPSTATPTTATHDDSDSDEDAASDTSSNRDDTNDSASDSNSLQDARRLVLSDLPYFLTREFIAPVLGLDHGMEYDMDEAIRRLEVIFSSPSCLNGSLLKRRCTREFHGVDVVEAVELFQAIRERLRPEDADSKTRLLFHMIVQQPMSKLPCDTNLEVILTNKVFPTLYLKPVGLESLRIYYIMLSYMLGSYKEKLLLQFMNRFLDLDVDRMCIILNWFYVEPVEYIVMFMSSLRQLLYKPAFRLKDIITRNDSESTQFEYEFLKTSLRFLRILNRVNLERNEPISFEKWHFSFLTDLINLQEDYFDWIENKGDGMIVLCDYAFLLDTRAKSKLMRIESVLKMKMAVTQAYTQNVHRLFTGQNIADTSPDSFVLEVDRASIVESTIGQLMRADEANFKKPLKIKFAGEEGEDEGGMAKEFFMLLSQRILNPDFGMFVEDEESHYLWFQDGELFYEKHDYYTIVGILCGLAIYNSITVYLPFPLSLYKKLLDRPPSYDDFKEMFPVLGRNLKGLFEYNEDDFEEKFNLNFTITRQVLGETKVHDLRENGSSTHVTRDNRKDYVNCFMRYFLVDAIKEQFQAFKNGFLRVCAGKMLSVLHPQELRSLVVGMQVQQWDDMKKHTQYRNGYSKDHPVILTFWEVFEKFTDEQKKEFLIFLTGTDRIPINGFEQMGVTIQRMDGGSEHEKLPVAHTCFNILDLPPYPSKERMRDKLLQATSLGGGFGII